MLRNLRPFALAAFGVARIAAIAQPGTVVPNQPEPTVILVPVLLSDPALSSGCWVQFYSGRDFKGEVATLVGPASVVTLDKGTARALRRQIDSLVLGPTASLTVFEHAMFQARSVTFRPNGREAGLTRKLGFQGRIESIRLGCSQ